MKTNVGLFDHAVLQRNARNVSDSPVSGECSATGTLRVRVVKGNTPVKGLNGTPIGKAARGKFAGQLTGIPAGGPFLVELQIADKSGKVVEKLGVKDVCVGDVWIAGGQSNMQGCGRFEQRAKKHPLVRAFYMNDTWAVAEDPIHCLETAVDPVHNGGNRVDTPRFNPNGVGPAVAFAQDMHKRTGVPQGVLACAHGGTSMSQWDPKLKNQGGGSLYGASIRRLEKNGGKISGIIWYQGESDCNAQAAPLYTDRMKELIAAFRRDAGDRKLPFVAVQLGRVAGWDGTTWNSVQDQERLLGESVKNVAIVPAIDLRLDDLIHIGGEDQHRLGRRLAYAMDAMIRGRKGGQPPITFRKIRLEAHPLSGNLVIVVEYDNVVGGLRVPEGIRPVGFSVCDPNPIIALYDIRLKGDEVHLFTTFARAALNAKTLHYGYGTDPICNITDAADRPLPVMGPLQIGEQRAMTAPVTKVQIAFPVALPEGVDAKLNGLNHAEKAKELPWAERHFANTTFLDLHTETEAYKPRDFVIYYRARLEVPEKMKLQAILGYDGPVKLWIDGREIFHDPDASNPAWEDRAKIPFNVEPGTHEVMVALASNQCRAWGIFLRFERLDVTAKQLKTDPRSIVLPRLIEE